MGTGTGTGPYVRHRASPVLRDPTEPGPGEGLCGWTRPHTGSRGRGAPHLCPQRAWGTPPVSPEGVGHPTCVTSWQRLCQHLFARALPSGCPCAPHYPGVLRSPPPVPAPSGAQGGLSQGEQRLRCGSAALAPLTNLCSCLSFPVPMESEARLSQLCPGQDPQVAQKVKGIQRVSWRAWGLISPMGHGLGSAVQSQLPDRRPVGPGRTLSPLTPLSLRRRHMAERQ